MKYTEETFKKEVELLYDNEFEVIGRFKGMTKPILLKSKYGILEAKAARNILKSKPTIMIALNKSEYFFNQLKEIYPEIAEDLTIESEYINAKTKILFNSKFGLVRTTPDALLSGHKPNIRSAINRKDYFYNQLKYLYQDYDYDFIIESTNRHEGRVILVCSEHGEQSIDSDWIFSGCGCPMCNIGWSKSTTLYIIELSTKEDCFYKLGISYTLGDGEVRRYKDYKSLGYEINEIFNKNFKSFEECINVETKLKKLIKNNLYTPKIWPYNRSTECFKENLLEVLINNI